MKKKICLSLLILVLLWGCDPIDNRLTIYNSTTTTVVPPASASVPLVPIPI